MQKIAYFAEAINVCRKNFKIEFKNKLITDVCLFSWMLLGYIKSKVIVDSIDFGLIMVSYIDITISYLQK